MDREKLAPNKIISEDITVTLQVLRTALIRHPGMRMGQLILNATYKSGIDLFYIRDEELKRLLSQY